MKYFNISKDMFVYGLGGVLARSVSIFYPMPLHLQKCFQYLSYNQNDFLISEKASREVISIPMNPFLNNDQLNFIISNIKKNI